MSFSGFVYNQIKGLAYAGRKLKPAETSAGKFFSRIISILLVALLIGLGWLTFMFGEIVFRRVFTFVVILVPLLVYIVQFWRGVSISWVIKGLFKYWLATFLLLYMFATLGFILFMVLTNNFDDEVIGLLAGTLLFVFAFFMAITYYHHAKMEAVTKGEKVTSYGVLIIWLCFLIGGLLALAVFTGAGDAFFNGVLGW